MLPMMLMNVVQASVALKRIDVFMNREELESKVEVIREDNKPDTAEAQSGNAIEIIGGTFQWESDQVFYS